MGLELSVDAQVKRTHDEFYAQESHKHNTKESFKFMGEKILSGLDSQITPTTSGGGGIAKSPKTILDIGCSNGDFLYYLSTLFTHAKLYGVDILPSLLEKTKQDFISLGLPCPELMVGNIVTGEGLPNQTFDLVFLNGVIGIFDDLHKPLEHFCSLISESGKGYIWACFNPYPIDVLIKARAVGTQHLESGWNLHSKQSVLEIVQNLGFDGRFYDDFEIGIDLPQTDDYLRTWTFKLENGKRGIVNGLSLLHHFSLFEVYRS